MSSKLCIQMLFNTYFQYCSWILIWTLLYYVKRKFILIFSMCNQLAKLPRVKVTFSNCSTLINVSNFIERFFSTLWTTSIFDDNSIISFKSFKKSYTYYIKTNIHISSIILNFFHLSIVFIISKIVCIE